METLLLTNGVIVTVDGERRMLEGHSLLAEGGRIAAIAPAGSLQAPGARVVDCAGCLILPGFIDCGGWAGTRPFGGWMQEYPAKRLPAMAGALAAAGEDWWRTEGAVMAGSRLRSGVTAGCVHYPAGFFAAGGYAAGVRAHLVGYAGVGGAVVPVVEPPLLAGVMAEGFAPRAYLPGLIASHRGRITDDFSGLADDDLPRLRAAMDAAAKAGVGITAGLWGRNLELLEQAGAELSGAEWLFQFCNDLTYAEIRRLQALGAAVAHLPQQTVRYAPFAELLEAGLRCAVMSEDIHSGGGGDMLQAVRRAQLLEQLRVDDLYYLPGGRQLELITIDAARALGIEARKGSLEAGKDADITVVDMEAPRTVPWRDMPLHRLMIDGNARQVREVVAGGRLLVSGGKLAGEEELREAAKALLPLVQSLPAGPEGWGRAVMPLPQAMLSKEVGA